MLKEVAAASPELIRRKEGNVLKKMVGTMAVTMLDVGDAVKCWDQLACHEACTALSKKVWLAAVADHSWSWAAECWPFQGWPCFLWPRVGTLVCEILQVQQMLEHGMPAIHAMEHFLRSATPEVEKSLKDLETQCGKSNLGSAWLCLQAPCLSCLISKTPKLIMAMPPPWQCLFPSKLEGLGGGEHGKP